LLVNGNETSGGKTIVITIGMGIFNFEEDIVIEYDGESIRMADDLSDALDPNDDGSHPEYLITIGSNGAQILVSIPHFSEHSISIYSLYVEEITRYTELVAIFAIGILFIAAFVMVRKGKNEY
ncbi:MAG: hypothetical protein JSW62_01795, partial [Thermoplasmatales archaeon]